MSILIEGEYIGLVSPVERVIKNMLEGLTPPGPPVYTPPSAESLGYPRRSDTDEGLTPSEMNRKIFDEGVRLAGYESIFLNDDRELLVFNTSAASTHTVLTVPYEDWEGAFRNQCSKHGIMTPNDILIHGGVSKEEDSPKPPKLVPLDILTWVMVRNPDGDTYMPCDINDLASAPTGDEEIDKHKIQLNEDSLQKLFEAVARRNALATATLLELHNGVLCPKMKFLRPKSEEDILQGCLSGYYRGDDAKKLLQFAHDHRGKGPMSNPTLHFRVTDHFTMEEANILDLGTLRLSFEDMIKTLKQKFPSYFSGTIGFAEIKPDQLIQEDASLSLKNFFSNSRFTEYDLLKSIDPISSLAHIYLAEWLRSQMMEVFSELNPSVELFAHHTSDYERELRVSEGATVIFKTNDNTIIPDQSVAVGITRLSQWIGGTLYPMWERINELVRKRIILSKSEYDQNTRSLMNDFGLPQEFINALSCLHPTEKQLKQLQGELNDLPENEVNNDMKAKVKARIERYQVKKGQALRLISTLQEKIREGNGDLDDLVRLLTIIQASQIFDNEGLADGSRVLNQGYNIPGVPGTAITYHFDDQRQLHLNIGWLLSTKGLSELWLGNIFKREERRDR